MKLQFLKPYPNSSITEKFEDIEINDFAIITGKNGVGKTHLLEAIVHNDNYINIDGGVNAIYFNYNDFVVENTSSNQQKNKSQLKKKNSNAHNINQELQNVKNRISQSIRTPLINAFRENNQLINQVYSYILNRVEFLNIPSFDEFQSNLIRYTNDIELLNSIYTLLNQSVDDFSKTKDKKFNFYYKKANSLNLSIQQINNTHLEYKETWLGQLLENEFKGYIKAFDKAQRKIIRNSSKNITQAEIEERIIKEVGVAPWIMLNEILEMYSCNGYIIDRDLAYGIETYQNIDQQPLNIVLKNYKIDRTINLDRLSSGEKTLFALAVALYRQEKDKNLPTVLLLDEIDSSLHPSMCRQLLDVLENVFVKKHNLKIIMVTHSPSTVALAPDDSVYVLENNNGKINLENKNKDEAIKFLSDGFATFNDGLLFLDRLLNNDKKISILTEGKNTLYIEKAISLLAPEISNDIEVIKGAESKSGKTQLKTLFDFISKIKHNQTIFFIWDGDCSEYTKLEEENNIIPFIFEKNNDNEISKKGIENLFREELFEGFYTEIKKSDGIIYKTFEENRKNDFFNLIEERNQKDDFEKFKPLVQILTDKIKGDSKLKNQ
ncbi:MAG: AAA family ATPase [Halarcobacter sp.]